MANRSPLPFAPIVLGLLLGVGCGDSSKSQENSADAASTGGTANGGGATGGSSGGGAAGGTATGGGATGGTATGGTATGGSAQGGNAATGGSSATGGSGTGGGGGVSGVYHTVGRDLYDPCGTKVVVRGVEQMFWSTSWISPSFVSEIAKTNANTIRILPQIDAPTPDGKPVMTLSDVEGLIQSSIAAKMLVDVAIDGGKDASVYVRSDVKQLLLKYERYIVIHAKGESYENTEADWATNAKAIVSQLRTAGYKAPLYLLPINAGRNLPAILDKGQEILDSDPLKNIVFGWQAYWGSSNYYQNLFKMTLAQAIAKAAAANFVIQLGLLTETDPGEFMDYSSAMAGAESNRLGWLWWDWRMSGSNLTTDGTYGHWATPGQPVVVSDPNSLQKTAVRTPFQLNGACN